MAECTNQESSKLKTVLGFPAYKFPFFCHRIFFFFFFLDFSHHIWRHATVRLLCLLESAHSLSHQSKQIPTHLTIIDCSVLSSVHLQIKWMYCSEIKLQEFRFSAWCSASLKSQVQSVGKYLVISEGETCYVAPLFRWNQITLQLSCNCLSLMQLGTFQIVLKWRRKRK